MAGLLNTLAPTAPSAAPAAAPTAPAASTSLQDPTLQQIESKIMERVTPSTRRMFMSCVNAGMAVLVKPPTSARIMQKLQTSTTLNTDIPTGVANIFATIFNEVGMRMPAAQRQQMFVPALLGAVPIIACHVMDIAEKMGRFKVTPQLAAQIIHDAAMQSLAKLHIGRAQIQQAVQAGKAKQPPGAAQAGA